MTAPAPSFGPVAASAVLRAAGAVLLILVAIPLAVIVAIEDALASHRAYPPGAPR